MESNKITILTSDSKYLAPGPVNALPQEWRLDGIVGSIIKRESKYEWNYKDGVIYDNNMYTWDGYNDEEFAEYIVLWHRKNNGNTQQFTITDKYIKYGNKKLFITNNNPARFLSTKGSIVTVKGLLEKDKNIKFMTYNVLVGHLMVENELPIQERFLNWDHPSKIRKNLIRKSMLGRDLMTLVEITSKMLEFLVPNSHEFIFCKKRLGEIDGSAIVYNSDRFKLILKHCKSIAQNKSQVTLSALLWDSICDRTILVTVLHLSSGYANSESTRLKEVMTAIKITNEWLLDNNIDISSMAHIIAGDLNSDRLAYKSKVKQWLEDIGFSDVFDGYKQNKYITYNLWQKSIFDYIFIRGPIKPLNLFIPASQSKSPNSKQGSDHLPLYADIKIC